MEKRKYKNKKYTCEITHNITFTLAIAIAITFVEVDVGVVITHFLSSSHPLLLPNS